MNKHNQPGNRDPDAEQNLDFELMKQKAVQTCGDWYDKDLQAKSPYNAEMDEMYKLYKSDHWNLLDESGHVLRTDAEKKNHPNAVENVAFGLIEGLVAEFSEPKELVDYPTEEGDDETARMMTDIKEFIAYKNRLDDELVKWLRRFFLYGTGIWEHNWDDDWQGGRGPNKWKGDVRWIARHPRSIIPDARCHESIHDGRRLHDATYWTIEDVEETFPGTGITPDSLSPDLMISEELEDTSAESNEDQVLIVITWYKGKPMILGKGEEDEGPGLHYILWAGDSTRKYLKHGNYVYFEPGEDVKFPFTVKKCYERENSPWGYGEAYFLKNPQVILNKTAEMIIEGHINYAIGQTWYDDGAVTEKQQKVLQSKGAIAGMWFQVADVNGIHREYGKGVPASLENETGRVTKHMESVVGRFDISQGKTPGNITAFRALDLLASRAQVRLRSKEMAINTGFEESGNYINRIVQENYTERRRYRILGKDDSKPKYGIFDADTMKKAYLPAWDESISYQELEVLLSGQENLPPEEQMVEGEDYEIYSPEFDTKCKVSSKMPSDRIFYMEMAKEFYTGGLIDDEIFWYVIEHGKFPPFEKLLEKIQQMKQQQQPVPGQDPELDKQILQFVAYLKVNDPETLQKILSLPEEQQMGAIMQLMQKMSQQPPEAAIQQQQVQQQPTEPEPVAVPEQANAQQIKQQLIDIAQTQS